MEVGCCLSREAQCSGARRFPGISFPISVSSPAKGSFKEGPGGTKWAGIGNWHGSEQQQGQELDPAWPGGAAGGRGGLRVPLAHPRPPGSWL